MSYDTTGSQRVVLERVVLGLSLFVKVVKLENMKQKLTLITILLITILYQYQKIYFVAYLRFIIVIRLHKNFYKKTAENEMFISLVNEKLH